MLIPHPNPKPMKKHLVGYQEYRQSIECYEKYLDIMERLDDKEGQALAHNYIGCAIQEKENLKLELVNSESGKNPVPEASIVEVHF